MKYKKIKCDCGKHDNLPIMTRRPLWECGFYQASNEFHFIIDLGVPSWLYSYANDETKTYPWALYPDDDLILEVL